MAIKRLKEIEDKVMKNYQEISKQDQSLKIVQLDNQALVADQISMQQEILKGNF
jgi:hypothetical protein